MLKQYNKLVRDNIPNILKEKKINCKCHVAKKEEYLKKLFEKLKEEIQEFEDVPSINEFADIMEVMEYIGKYYKFNLDEIKLAKKMKKMTRGGFNKRIVLESTNK